jgi:hypothetical protein
MHCRFGIASAGLVALVTVSNPGTAMAAAPRSLQSIQATATFAYDESACLRTYVQVAAIRDTVHETGGEPEISGRLLMSVEKMDRCAGVSPVTVFNGQGGAILRDEDFDVVAFLESATLHPVFVEMYDWVSEQPFGLTVSGQWNGTGGLADSHSYPMGNPDGPGVLNIQNNRFRNASAEVEITTESPGFVPVGQLVWAQLASVHWTLMR